jgi:hypothetical protein
VDQGHQRVERSAVAVAPRQQKLRDVGRVGHRVRFQLSPPKAPERLTLSVAAVLSAWPLHHWSVNPGSEVRASKQRCLAPVMTRPNSSRTTAVPLHEEPFQATPGRARSEQHTTRLGG